MLKQLIAILLLSYFSFGTICLTQGDFSEIADLHKMYVHCKATEDKNMTPFDFITDHLLNIDGLFDKHDNGDEQKPHSPIQYHQVHLQLTFVNQQFAFVDIKPIEFNTNVPIYANRFYFSEFTALIFRPPIV